jgi:arginase
VLVRLVSLNEALLIMKTTKLLYPEWQGFGIDNHASGGAFTMHEAFMHGSKFVEIDVLRKEHLLIEDGILGRSSIIKNSKHVFDRLNVEQPDRIFMIGGTCGSELAPVAYLNQRYHCDLAVLWFDAHGDLNTPQSSPSGHFHGMVLRTLLGEGDPPKLVELMQYPLVPPQVTLAGIRDLDMPEATYVSTAGITIIPPEILTDLSLMRAAVERSGSSNLYIHLDLDFFNQEDFNGAQVPVSGGLTIDQFGPILTEINSRYKIVGLSIVEFVSNNPKTAAKIPNLFEKCGITCHLS